MKLSIPRLFQFILLIVIYKFVLSLLIPKVFITVTITLLLGSIFIYMLITVIVKEFITNKFRVINVFIYCLFILLIIYTVITFIFPPNGVLPEFIGISFTQLMFPLLFLFIVNNISLISLKAIVKKLFYLLIPIVIFSIFEILLPRNIKKQILSCLFFKLEGTLAIPTSYDFDYFGLMRVGSLFFEPLTLSFVTLFLLGYLVNNYKIYKKGRVYLIITALANLFSFGKSALFAVSLSIMSIFTRKKSGFLYIGIVIFIIFYFVKNGKEIASTNANFNQHYLGLITGIEGALLKPFGNGVGSAGYLIFLKCDAYKIEGPFFNKSNNGNESTIGILLYQLGWLYTALFLSLLFFIFNSIYISNKYFTAGTVIGFIIALFFSESLMSIVVIATFSTFIIYEFRQKNSNN